MHDNNASPSVSQTRDNVTWHPNRAYIQLSSNIVIDSCFPGGNVASAQITSNSPLTVQVEGNTDISMDPTAKYWLYFRIRGFRKDRPIKFVLRNANHLRKYIGQTRVRPYMVYRQEGEESWQPLSAPIDLSIVENGQIQGSFIFQGEKNLHNRKINLSTNDLHRGDKMTSTAPTEDARRGSCYFSMYYPYGCDELTHFMQEIRQKIRDGVYYNEETIAYSFERRRIPLLTITSTRNIESYAEKEHTPSPEIFPYPKDRPFKLKNCPVILMTARVHPSETSSSYFVEGLVTFLMGASRAAWMLRELFIFQVMPMLNPDGVEHGNFRFDHQLRNLNRFYGQSSIQKTPAIRAAEILINYYKQPLQQAKFTAFYEQCYPRLFLYADIHGHCSPMPSFIYGNHTERLDHAIENRLFCRILESSFIPGGFSRIECDFSKKNMTSQEKHDEFSKLCSGRVFAGRANPPDSPLFHSYTLELLPYWQEFSRWRGTQKIQKQRINAAEYARLLGKTFLGALLDLLDINPESKFNEADMIKMRRQVEKECQNEHSRKLLSIKRADSSNQHSSPSEKAKSVQNRNIQYYKQYISRWFSNPQYLNHLASHQELLRQPKFTRFLQLNTPTKLPLPQPTISPRKQLPHQRSKAITEPRQGGKEKERTIFVCRKDRGKVQNRINKQTLELQHDFLDLLPSYHPRPNNIHMDFATFKRESLPRKEAVCTSTDRYEHELLSTIVHQEQKKMVFEVRVKQLMPKRNDSRIQTETIASQPSLPECPPSLPFGRHRERSTPPRQAPRPSFLEQFMLKIREERQASQVFLQKQQQGRGRMRSCVRDQLEEQERKLLPILRRNRIFTLGEEESRAFESMAARRLGLQQAALKTKKTATAQRKQQVLRDQLLKKSQKVNQYRP